MTVDMTADEARVEREQVEHVFGLTGGELSDKPWEPFVPNDEAEPPRSEWDTRSSDRTMFRYWYEGRPSYAGDDFEEPDEADATLRTVVRCELHGEAPAELRDDDGILWRRVTSYASSGEADCPCAQDDDGNVVGPDGCPLCEADVGGEHGCIYLGAGWAEVVYRSEPKYTLSCSHVDTCLGCYIQDHCNGEGEQLFGVSLGGSAEDAIDSMLSDADKVPEDIEDDQLRAAFADALKGVDLRYIDEDGNPADEAPDDRDSEDPQAWFRLTWERT